MRNDMSVRIHSVNGIISANVIWLHTSSPTRMTRVTFVSIHTVVEHFSLRKLFPCTDAYILMRESLCVPMSTVEKSLNFVATLENMRKSIELMEKVTSASMPTAVRLLSKNLSWLAITSHIWVRDSFLATIHNAKKNSKIKVPSIDTPLHIHLREFTGAHSNNAKKIHNEIPYEIPFGQT